MVERLGWRRGLSAMVATIALAALALPLLGGAAGATGSTPSATALSVDATSVVVGAPVTLRAIAGAAIGGAGAGAAGRVTFSRASTVSGTATAVATVALVNGVATLTTTKLPLGTSFITATYLGSSTYQMSVSAPVPVTVAKAATATVLTESPGDPAGHVAGAPESFTASVSVPGSPAVVPVGMLTFNSGARRLATVRLAGGSASFTSSTLPVGAQSLTVTYTGSASLATSTSDGLALVVGKADASMSLTTTDLSPVKAESVTLRAHLSAVAPSTALVTGTVTFVSNGVTLGTTAVSSSVATLTTTRLPAGPASVTASYGGSSRVNSTSVAVVTQATTAAVRGSGNSALGDPVDLTATITPVGTAHAKSTGSVTFSDGSTVVGSANLIGGQATLTIDSLALGDHAITASYGGGGGGGGGGGAGGMFGTSRSAAFTQHVGQATTGVTVTGPCCDVSGQDATFTAQVSATNPAAGTPTGEVAFSATANDGASPPVDLGTVPVVAGQAQEATPMYKDNDDRSGTRSAARDFTVHATYSGDTNFIGSSGDSALTITNGDTTTAVTVSPDPSTVGDHATLTATVGPAAPASGTPSGTVTFSDGSNPLATVTLTGGVAVLDTTSLGLGSHTITAAYGGDNNFNGSTGPAGASVVDPLSVVVGGSTSSALVGDPVDLSATVRGGSPDYTYSWTVSFIPPGQLPYLIGVTAATTANPTFVPDVPGSDQVELVVTDSAGRSSTAKEQLEAAPATELNRPGQIGGGSGTSAPHG